MGVPDPTRGTAIVLVAPDSAFPPHLHVGATRPFPGHPPRCHGVVVVMSGLGCLSPLPAALCGSLALQARSRTDSSLIRLLQPPQLAQPSLDMAVPGPCPPSLQASTTTKPSGPAEPSPAPRSPPETRPLGLTALTARSVSPRGRSPGTVPSSRSLPLWAGGHLGVACGGRMCGQQRPVSVPAPGSRSLGGRRSSRRSRASLKRQLWEVLRKKTFSLWHVQRAGRALVSGADSLRE